MVHGWWWHCLSPGPGAVPCTNLITPTTKLERNETRRKRKSIYHVEDLSAAPAEWKVDDVRNLATISTVTAGSTALGVAVGPRQFIADQLSAKADDIRAMHERVQLCQDLQTESALLRESLGVSRITNSLRVHGHTILQEKRAAAIYDEIGQRSLERLFRDSRRTLWSKPHAAQASPE